MSTSDAETVNDTSPRDEESREPQRTKERDEKSRESQDTSEIDVEINSLESLQKQIAEWKDLAQRRTADVENIRRRSRQREDELIAYSSEHVITKMLPVLDDLHAAVLSSKSTSDADALRTGLEMIYQKALKIFTDAGVVPIETDAGEPFDVDKHEALMHTSSEHPEGAVVQTVQRGYQLHDKVLRHAKVITSAGKE